jgi:hypothetical protein
MSSYTKQATAAAAAFLLVGSAWVYGVLNRDPQLPTWQEVATLVLVAVVHVAVGRAIGWRAFLLPLALALIAIPAGKPEPDSDTPIFVLLIIWLPVSFLLVGAGALWRERSLRRSGRWGDGARRKYSVVRSS